VILAQAGAGHTGRFLVYLACANLAAFGLRLTSAKSVLPAGFLFLMLGIEDLTLPELLFIAVSITLLREARTVRRLSDVYGLLYAIASVTIGVAAAQPTYSTAAHWATNPIFPAPIIAGAFVLMANCGLSAMLLTKPKEPCLNTYNHEYRLLLPWFVATAYLAYLVQCAGIRTGYNPALIALPVLFTLDRGYRRWCDTVVERKEELAQLHRNTLETLALAIDARDQTTHMHLRRVQVYALAVGRELRLTDEELEALNVAALLHDIGKLGIPDHILLKPGSLTTPEWDKMKTHALIGAEMLTRMHFPELVTDIVKTHHEKWDGSGYPFGICGDDIPIGARILSAVDCLDALASDRPYRAALPLDEAMAMVRSQEAKSYDPAIISILQRRYIELDQLARGTVGHPPVEADRWQLHSPAAAPNNILDPIVSARQETQLLQALASELAQAARLDEVAQAIHKSLSQKIGYDTLGIYIRRNAEMEAIYFLGAHESLFTKKTFPLAEGLSGWVAQHRNPILNGNVAVECCYANNSQILYNLQTALAVPFEGKGGTAGVITLYHMDRNAFSQDDLRIMEAASLQIGPAIEAALKFQNVEETAATDHLTGIPNARALALHLEQELKRAARENSRIGVLVCDLDGFKQVNDRFGHLTGDEVLRTVAQGLRDACRGYDYLARMGGDEFVVVLNGLQGDYSTQLERMRQVAVQAGLTICGEPCLSMSVGVAIYPVDGHDTETLIKEADRRMYRLKYESKSLNAPATAFLAGPQTTPDNDLRELAQLLSADENQQPAVRA
jgi:diguanylate cyclase (GGDEF)-like protein/putative nucleotidyltransferase with HDIG domain